MKKLFILGLLLILNACAGNFNAEKLDIRKDCTGNESNKTLVELFCKKN